MELVADLQTVLALGDETGIVCGMRTLVHRLTASTCLPTGLVDGRGMNL
jgi:hypothetical protein